MPNFAVGGSSQRCSQFSHCYPVQLLIIRVGKVREKKDHDLVRCLRTVTTGYHNRNSTAALRIVYNPNAKSALESGFAMLFGGTKKSVGFLLVGVG